MACPFATIPIMDTVQIDCETCGGSGERVDDWNGYSIVNYCEDCDGIGAIDVYPEIYA